MKKTLAMVLALVMMFTLLTGCGGGGGDSGGDGTGAEYTWRMALNGSAPGELGYDMATFFKEKVEELTSGRVSIEFYGGNSLGSTTEVLEGMAAGVADITCESVGTLAPSQIWQISTSCRTSTTVTTTSRRSGAASWARRF